jgi:hypothetical protein
MTRIIEKLIWWLSDKCGFGILDDSETRRALRRLAYIGVAAWAVAGAAVATDQFSPLYGMALLSLVGVILCGAVLISSQTNEELATMIASNQDAMKKRAPAAAAPSAPPPTPAPAAVRAAPPPPPPPPVAPTPAWQVLSQGEIAGRAYVIFADGSIEIATAFGPRWFASVDLAHEFIGLRNGSSLRLSATPQLARVA